MEIQEKRKDNVSIMKPKNEARTKTKLKLDDNLYARREKYRHKAFTLMLELAFIIGVPAFLALWGGKKLDAQNQTNLRYTFIFLSIAFIFSWTAIIIKYIKFSREIKKIDQEISKARNKQD